VGVANFPSVIPDLRNEIYDKISFRPKYVPEKKPTPKVSTLIKHLRVIVKVLGNWKDNLIPNFIYLK